MEPIVVEHKDGIDFLKSLKDNSVDLILTDPPYIISKESGMNKFAKEIEKIEESGQNKKTEKEWEEYKKKKKLVDHGGQYKKNFIKYGNTSGKKYTLKTDYGEWDKNFTIKKLQEFINLFYKKLRKGGTCIIWFDLWKLSYLKEIMENYKFKQIRFIEWIKTNPMPLNQKINYLTTSRETALLGVKGGKPTFNSKYDNGIYKFPIQSGKKGKRHPTQKSLSLFEELIKKHSNEGDLVVDTFLGGGTTAFASRNTNRKFMGCEIDINYFDIVQKNL